MSAEIPVIRTLLIEDNPGDADLVMERASFDVHRNVHFEVQETLSSAMESLSASSPDLVLLDLGLPDSQGIPSFEKLHQAFPDIPVVVLTGNDDMDLAISCIERGAQDFLVKGKAENLIAATIHHAVARARSQRALNESHQNLQRMIEGSPDSILVLDSHCKILFANDVAVQLLGKRVETGERFDLFSGNDFPEELEWEREDGSIVILEGRTGDTSWYGEPAVILTLRNITDRKKMERDKEHLLAAIEQTEDTVIVTNLDGTINYVNPAFELSSGYKSREVLGKKVGLLVGKQSDAKFYHHLQSTLNSGNVWKGRIDQRHKNGNFYTVESTISPVTGPDGNRISYVAVNRDITEHLRIQEENNALEEQLRQSQKMESVGRLAAGIAHDFNNMLSVILGNAQLIMFRLQPDTPLYKEVSMIEEAALRSSDLTRQLLTFSRRQTMQPALLNLNDIIHGVEKMLCRIIGEENILQLALCSPSFPVLVDQGQLEQVLLNLVVNAKDAMPKGGRILIETNRVEVDEVYSCWMSDLTPGHYMQLAVTDTGTGIPTNDVEQIFEPFFTTKEIGKGTGLGLSMVYGIIKQSGGSIQVYSEENHGTTFKIYLPKTDESDHHPAPSPESSPEVRKTHILVVEDEKLIRKHLINLLKELGHEVTLAANGQEALHMIEKNKLSPGLMITDIVMPEMNGMELVKRARKTLPSLKTLYMSGYTDNVIKSLGILSPGTPFIPKPFSFQDFEKKVNEVLNTDIPHL